MTHPLPPAVLSLLPLPILILPIQIRGHRNYDQPTTLCLTTHNTPHHARLGRRESNFNGPRYNDSYTRRSGRSAAPARRPAARPPTRIGFLRRACAPAGRPASGTGAGATVAASTTVIGVTMAVTTTVTVAGVTVTGVRPSAPQRQQKHVHRGLLVTSS